MCKALRGASQSAVKVELTLETKGLGSSLQGNIPRSQGLRMDDQVELSDAYGVTDAREQFSPTSSSFVSSFPLTLHYWRFVRKSTVFDESLCFVSYFSRLRRKSIVFMGGEKYRFLWDSRSRFGFASDFLHDSQVVH